MKRTMLILFSILMILTTLSVNGKDKNTRVDVMYFHATMRCQGCLRIEEFIKNSVNDSFSAELKDSLVVFSALDFQQQENEHYQDDYKFDVQTLILSKKINGKEVKWKNLDKIWDYSSDYQKFQKYIEEEINKFFKES